MGITCQTYHTSLFLNFPWLIAIFPIQGVRCEILTAGPQPP